MKDITVNNRIANEIHFKNIFLKNSYTELGIIDVGVLERLLKHELVKFSDIYYFPILNTGLGHSTINNEELQKSIPFLFLKELSDNDASIQLCITHGLLKYKSIDEDETFMPIVLLPINIYFEREDIYCQMIGNPVINEYISNVSVNVKFNQLQSINIKSIMDLDNVLYQLDKINNIEVKLENFLTYATIKGKDIVLNSKYSIKNRLYYENKKINAHLKYTKGFLSKEQNEALDKLLTGENLGITGYNGCGKTTVAESFIINAVCDNKNVLYISNSHESINRMYNFLKDNNLEKNVLDLNNSFYKNCNKVYTYNKELIYDDELINDYKKKIKELDIYFDNYEKTLGYSINDFKILDLIKRRFVLDDDKFRLDENIIDNDKLRGYYKNEIEEIISQIKIIEDNYNKIPSFKNSTWKEIPYINNVNHANQIITIVLQLNTGLKKLKEYEASLNEYGMKSIQSFSEMRKYIVAINNLKEEVIPYQWKNNIDLFYKACSKYEELRNNILKYVNTDNYLNNKYKNLLSIDIDEEIKKLYGSFYKESDKDLINAIIKSRPTFKNIIASINSNLLTFDSNYLDINLLSDFDFIQKDDYFLDVKKLVKLFNTYDINHKIIELFQNNHIGTISKDLNSLNKKITNVLNDIKELEISNPKLSKIDIDKIKDITNDIKSYIEKKKKLKRLTRDYRELIGFSYENNTDVINTIELLKEYYHEIKQKSYFDKLVKIMNLCLSDLTLNELNLIMSSYDEIIVFATFFNKYGFDIKSFSIKNGISKLKEYLKYLDELYKSNDCIKSLINDFKDSYAYVDEYYKIKMYNSNMIEMAEALRNNNEFYQCFGYLYSAEETSISNVSNVIKLFNEYIHIFNSDDDALKSFKDLGKIKIISSNAFELINEIIENLRLYGNVFKDSISRYYYSNIKDNVAYLSKLLESRDELQIYLNITRAMTILHSYNLDEFIDYIVNLSNIKGVSNAFSRKYYDLLIDDFFSKNPIDNSNDYINKLNVYYSINLNYINNLNNKILDKNVDRSSNMTVNLKYNSYKEYLRYNNRYKVLLSNQLFAGMYYKYMDYDIIIIDDSHMITHGDFNSLFKNKQIVVLGDYQSNKIVNQNLLSLINNLEFVTLKNRYIKTPRLLSNNLSYVISPIPLDYSKNKGISVLTEKIVEKIYDLYKNNKDVRINYFIKDYNHKRDTYEKICSYLLSQKLTPKEIINFMTYNLFIGDITNRNYIASDFNILYLRDYCNENSQIVSSNLFEILTLTKEELIIYDSRNYLKQDFNYDFFKQIKSICNDNNIFKGESYTKVDEKLTSLLEKRGYEIYYPSNHLNFVIKKPKENKLYPFVLLFDSTYLIDVKNNFCVLKSQYNLDKIIVRTVVDLLDTNKLIDSICEEIDG